MKRGIGVLLVIALIFGAVLVSGYWGNKSTKAAKTTTKKTIMVCSGAGLMKPVSKFISLFENRTGDKVQVNYGGSAEIFGILQTTCECDVFIPGAYKYTQDALKRGYIIKNTIKNLTLHVPVIIVHGNNPKHIQSLKDLARPGVRIVLGDPKACAIGKVAKKILDKNGLWKKVKPNVVTFTPTVNQLLVYIATGQADAAIVWEDITTWAQARGKIKIIPISPKQNIIKTIPTAVTTCAKKHGVLGLAKSFNKFVATPRSLAIWEKWGFKPCQ